MNSLHILEQDTLRLGVDAECGGRIMEFSVSGRNALAQTGPQIGSTFWPSPQQAWGWPPPAALDSQPYTVFQTSNELHLQSPRCEQTQLCLEKRFKFAGRGLRVEIHLRNLSATPAKWAPWEITRVYGGISFYESKQPVMAHSSATASYQDGCVWHQYIPQQQTGHEKLFGNGSAGWLANVYQGLLLVKRFEPIADVEQVAPGEAEVEIYAHGDGLHQYIELEQQGCYQSIPPGESITWQVEWLLSEIPNDCRVEVGSRDLIALAVAMLEQSGVGV